MHYSVATYLMSCNVMAELHRVS